MNPAGRICASVVRKVGHMKICCRRTLLLLGAALAMGILVLILLYTGVLTLSPVSMVGRVFFPVAAVLSGGGLLGWLLALLLAERTPALGDAWFCCGELSAIGAAGALLISLVTWLTASLEILLYIGAALLFACLLLFAGGLLCFLRRYLTACFCQSR